MKEQYKQEHRLITCECGDPAHQIILSWFDNDNQYDDYAYLTVHLNKLPLLKRLKVAIQYIFGKQSEYGAFDEVLISPSEWKKFQDMVDFMKRKSTNVIDDSEEHKLKLLYDKFTDYLEDEIDTPYKGERKCYERILEKFKKIYKEI